MSPKLQITCPAGHVTTVTQTNAVIHTVPGHQELQHLAVQCVGANCSHLIRTWLSQELLATLWQRRGKHSFRTEACPHSVTELRDEYARIIWGFAPDQHDAQVIAEAMALLEVDLLELQTEAVGTAGAQLALPPIRGSTRHPTIPIGLAPLDVSALTI